MASTANGSTPPGLVVLAFAKTPLSLDQRLHLCPAYLNEVLPGLMLEHGLDHMQSHANPKTPRWLDFDEATDTARVLELRYETTSMPTMDQCKALALDPELPHGPPGLNFELVIQPRDLYERHKHPGLAVFDMDSTLIQQEVIDELARAVGLYDKVAAITEAAMRGEAPYTDFEASLRARVGLLKGVPGDIWERLKGSGEWEGQGVITFTPGARELVRCLRKLGWKTAVLSGGFTPLARWVKEVLGLDYAFANHLATDPETGVLTGELVEGEPIIHAAKKRELLLKLAEREGVDPSHAIAVGDGSNDLLMMGAAGLGVAFNAKPKVQAAAPCRINGRSLEDVLYMFGYSKAEIDDLLR